MSTCFYLALRLWLNFILHLSIQDIELADDSYKYHDEARDAQLIPVQKKENIIEKSFDKLKEASTV